jgi:hypothetical protein
MPYKMAVASLILQQQQQQMNSIPTTAIAVML